MLRGVLYSSQQSQRWVSYSGIAGTYQEIDRVVQDERCRSKTPGWHGKLPYASHLAVSLEAR